MKVAPFNEIVIICDKQSHWVWNTVTAFLQKENLPFIHLSSEVSLRKSWSRIHNAPKFIVHWESTTRLGGSVIEELLEINPKFEMEDRLLIISSDPQLEDQVYFTELGATAILEIKNNHLDIKNSRKQLGELLIQEPSLVSKRSRLWRKLTNSIAQISENAPGDFLKKIKSQIDRAGELDQKKSAPYFHCLGYFLSQTNQWDEAEKYWRSALKIDANYYPSQDKIIELYRQRGNHQNALNILKQLQSRNKNNISRLVKMGEIHQEMHDQQKAEHYYKLALDKDENCSAALNGLATIRFEQGKLDESRSLLAQSSMASKVASTLNKEGIILVREQKYEEALNHYSKAQYVLPQQDKSPMLFFNMGLCYSRWGRTQSAKQFLQIALIKEPNYKKAQRLLDQIMDEAA